MPDAIQRRPHERLTTFASVRTRDVGEAQSGLGRLFSPHSLQPDGPLRRFHATANSVALGDVRLIYMSLGTATTIRPDPLGYYAAVIVLGGRSEFRQPTGVVRSDERLSGAVINPGIPTEMAVDDGCEQLSVLVGRHALNSRREVSGHVGGPLDLAVRLDPAAPRTKSWLELVGWAVRTAEHGGLLENRLAAARLEDLLILGLLDAQRPEITDDKRTGAGIPARVARVVDLIHDDPASPLTSSQLATAAGVSIRALQAEFRRHLGTSPSAYLRDVRLDQVRANLQRSEPPVTVTEIAMRWGFTHVPRFAAAYRQRFGELPSYTLRRVHRA